MKLYVFYTPHTPADRDIAEFQRRLAATTSLRAELVDADSRDGVALAELYDVMQRPAVVLADDDGRQLQKWEGTLPSPEELAAYTVAP